jgi:hypothetical protein
VRTVGDIRAQIKAAAAEAARGCGQSDVLFESRLQSALAAILEQSSDEDRPAIEAELYEAGFDPDFEPYVAGPGECSLTGIDVNCCPCGSHP